MPRTFQICLLFFLLSFLNAYAQEKEKHVYFSFPLNSLHISDQHISDNAFVGPHVLQLQFGVERILDDALLEWNTRIGAGLLFRDGVHAWDLSWKAMDLSYNFELIDAGRMFYTLGPAVLVHYSHQQYMYEDEQASSWFTHYSLGPNLLMQVSLANIKPDLKIRFYNAFVGMASRPKADGDPFANASDFGQLLKDWHSNISFGSFKSYTHILLELGLSFERFYRYVDLSYNITYTAWDKEPEIRYLTQGVMVKIYFKQ